ncbi:SigE family RNA polymerase sigma factor [Dactylosporangium sp. NPDC005555]|uniref:SigE family RNA polymerase sigma factor n=1 Tax=Dactylosporangium sp. NPDC005555 TaxID=3154889 RepID=UPI0033BE1DBF
MRDFDEFVTVRSAALLRFAYLLTGDRHLAEDLTQEALVRAHRRWHAITGPDGPEPYVRRAILRQYLSWRRRRASTERPVAVVSPVPSRGDLDLAERVVEADEMWTALSALPRSQRAVIVLRYYEDLPDAEIAGLLGCAQATVRVHAFHALHRLRSALSPVPLRRGEP